MSKQRVIAILAFGYRKLNDPYYQGFAAQVAYYLLLSVVPTIILLSQILGIFSISIEVLKDWIAETITPDAAGMILELFDYAPSGAVSTVFVLIVLWSASRAQFAMFRITNYTFSDGITTGHGYFIDRIHSVVTMLITLFTMTFALVVFVYGQGVLDLLFSALPGNKTFLVHVNQFWVWMRWPAAMALYFLMVTLNYYILPMHRVRLRRVLPGSLLASVGMLAVTVVFSQYLNRTTDYDIIYGSLAAVVALLIWFYLIAWVLGLGVIFNKAWADSRA